MGIEPKHPSSGGESLPSRAPWIVLFLVVGTVLRLPHIGESLWYDEVLYATRQTVSSLSDLWRFSTNLPSAPLYRILMFLWNTVFGENELAVRIPSLVFGIASILLTYVIADRYGSRRTAILAALLLCLSPVHIWYSQEATPYAMALCFLLSAVYVGIRLRSDNSGRGRYVVYFGCFLVAVFTHYYTAIFLLPLSVVAIKSERAVRKRIMTAHGVIGLCLASALSVKYLSGHWVTGMAFLRSFTGFEWWMLFFNWFLHGNSLWTVNPYVAGEPGGRLWLNQPLLLVFQGIFLVILIKGLAADRGKNNRAAALELSLYLFVPPLVLLLMTRAGYRHLYIERYLLPGLPFFLIVLSRGMTGSQKRMLSLAPAAALLCMSLTAYGLFLYKSDTWTVYKQNPDWRGVARYLLTRKPAVETPAVFAVTPADALNYYLRKAGRERQPTVRIFSLENLLPVLQAENPVPFYLIRNRYWTGPFDRVFHTINADRRFRRIASYSVKGLDVYTFIAHEGPPDGSRSL